MNDPRAEQAWRPQQSQQQQQQQHHTHGDPSAPAVFGLDGEDLSDFLNFDNGEFSGIPFIDDSNLDNGASTPAASQPPGSVAGPNMLHSQPASQFGFNTAELQSSHGQVPSVSAMGSKQSEYYSANATMRDDGSMGQMSVPPTPNSTGMYADHVQYMQRMTAHPQNYSHQQQHHHNQPDMRDPNFFTPMMSPEFDGSESTMSYAAEYQMPNTFNLNPISSPAMNPQRQRAEYQAGTRGSNSMNSSLTASPIALAADDRTDDTERPRKSRRKAPTVKSQTAPTKLKKSVATPTSRRKGSLNLQIPPTTVEQPNSDSAVSQGTPQLQSAQGNSTSESVSPQPLNDGTMAPPPKPMTRTAPPAEQMQHDMQSGDQTPDGLPAATPASIMRLQAQNESEALRNLPETPYSNQMSPATRGLESSLELLQLPEAASAPPQAKDAQTNSAAQHLNRQPSKKRTQSGGPSGTQSPHASAVMSPTTPGGADKAVDGKSIRHSKKRNSSSNLVSPALRPKISPSIKPLLPEGANGISQDTHALLLASKSNYQNILEGNTLPGVSYPTELSTNLSSKRTSHKLAEQGRRNRMNLALQEMQTLLPSPFNSAAIKESSAEEGPEATNGEKPSSSGSKGSNGGNSSKGNKTPSTPSAAGTGNSKAATVECAIEYIKHLQQEQREKDEERLKMAQELEKLKATA